VKIHSTTISGFYVKLRLKLTNGSVAKLTYQRRLDYFLLLHASSAWTR